MSLYTVTEPCVIGQLHYATVPAQPIEVDDELAAPLVEAGSLVPFRAQGFVEQFAADAFKPEVDPGTFTLADPESDKPVRGPSRRTRRVTED